MNLLHLVIKQMRQRALGTWLTMFSVLLAVALWAAISIFMREGDALFGQRDYGYDVLVGAKGSPLQLVINSVYHLDKSPGNIPYDLYEQMISPRGAYRGMVKLAVPFALGDTYKDLRILATSPKMFGMTEEGREMTDPFQYRKDKPFKIAQGRIFHPQKLEAIIGSEVTKLTGLKLGDKFFATHGAATPGQAPDEHKDIEWEVVGVLAPTHTAADKVLYIPLITFYCVQEHEHALDAQAAIKAGEDPSKIASPKPASQPASKPTHDDHDHASPATTQSDHDHNSPAAAKSDAAVASDAHDDHDHHEDESGFTRNADGTISVNLPKDEWQISGIFVRSRAPFYAQNLMYTLNNRNEAQGVNPASTMKAFFDTFLAPYGKLLQIVSNLVLVVASVSILVSIYNSVSARKKEIAILRALGATKSRILTMLCVEAGVIGFIGGLLGLLAGHLLVAGGSAYLQQLIGQGIAWHTIDRSELLYLGLVVLLAVLAGLVPGLKAYSTPVATNLVVS